MTEPPMTPDEFARLVADIEPEELARGIETNGEQLLELMFAAMPATVDPDAARRLDTVIEWRIARGGDATERWQLAIRRGEVAVERDGGARPDVVLTMDAMTFVRMAAGLEQPPALWLRGRLKIGGNLLLAARLPRIIRAGRARGG